MKRTVVQIINAYADRAIATRVQVESPEPGLADYEDWWEEVVFPETGDGKGGDAVYTAIVLRSDVPELVGQSYEWMG